MPTIEELERIVRNNSVAYERSTAFAMALNYVKENDEELYRDILTTEVEEMGLMP